MTAFLTPSPRSIPMRCVVIALRHPGSVAATVCNWLNRISKERYPTDARGARFWIRLMTECRPSTDLSAILTLMAGDW